MDNLAGNYDCDKVIRRELVEAGISIFGLPSSMQSEVPSALLGVLCKNGTIVFKMNRARYYWIVKGDVPLDVAQELYLKGSVGKGEIRAGGDCECRPPERWAGWRDDQGRHLSTLKEKEKYAAVIRDHPDIFDDFVFVEDPSAVGHRFVTLYHIDTQEGLNLFVKTLREYGIVD